MAARPGLARDSQTALAVSPQAPPPDEHELRTQRAMRAIVDYVRGHPLAADSEEGIAQWWLGEMGVDASTDATREALERLVRRQVLQRHVLADGSVIYRSGPALAAPVRH